MLFASAIFLYVFLPVFLAVYYLLPSSRRALWITLASYVFYGWWRPDFVLLMWFSTALDFTCGARIERARARGSRGRRWLWASVVTNLGLLAYFKYANFGVDTLNAVLSRAGMETIDWPAVVLPVGISFYTFQTMSYTIDVYRGTAPVVRSLSDFMCYVAMFPQLVAGPIVRYNTVAEQLVERTHTLSKFQRGVLAFQAGLAKKVLIADVLAPVADQAFGAAGALSTADAWLGTLAYAFQIYFDFSGYSDMAIGLGLMIGFRFPINFDQPYRAVSITDFWRRWHVSLSTFLRDYLYIPLGGNAKGRLRTYVNLSLTMLLGGLWHGAAWTFVVWGAYQGAWLIAERALGKRSPLASAPRFAQVAFTFALACLGWVFFRAVDLPAAGRQIAAMFGAAEIAHATVEIRPLHWIALAIAAAVVWLAPTTQVLLQRCRTAWVAPLQVLFVLALVHLHYEHHVPFLYFQF
jgi:alginate O-acetyltransferase complex protein AlgI